MRYRIGETAAAAHPSGDVVTATVWFTLVVGVLFLVLGVRGRQRWLQFWGTLTCACCIAYFLRGMLGLSWLG